MQTVESPAFLKVFRKGFVLKNWVYGTPEGFPLSSDVFDIFGIPQYFAMWCGKGDVRLYFLRLGSTCEDAICYHNFSAHAK